MIYNCQFDWRCRGSTGGYWWSNEGRCIGQGEGQVTIAVLGIGLLSDIGGKMNLFISTIAFFGICIFKIS